MGPQRPRREQPRVTNGHCAQLILLAARGDDSCSGRPALARSTISSLDDKLVLPRELPSDRGRGKEKDELKLRSSWPAVRAPPQSADSGPGLHRLEVSGTLAVPKSRLGIIEEGKGASLLILTSKDGCDLVHGLETHCTSCPDGLSSWPAAAPCSKRGLHQRIERFS